MLEVRIGQSECRPQRVRLCSFFESMLMRNEETTLCFDFQNVSSKFNSETFSVGTQNENWYILHNDSASLESET